MLSRSALLSPYAPALTITGERRRLLVSFGAVFLFGMLAHGYAFTNLTVSHDSLNEMYLFGSIHYAAGSVAEWKISLGRFLYPAYRLIFSGAAGTPWLSGILSLVWISLAVYLIARMFAIDHVPLLAVLAGLCTVNATYSALTATYIFDLDGDMLAVLLAVLAAYLWFTRSGRRRIFAAIPVVLSLALYQAMVSVTVTLIMIACILRLWKNESAKDVFLDGLSAIGILLLAGAVYYLLVRAVCSAADVAIGSGYNGLANLGKMTLSLVPAAIGSTYKTWLTNTLRQPFVWNSGLTHGIHLLLVFILLAAFVPVLIRKKLPAANLLLGLALTALLPFGMNLCGYLNYAGGAIHLLMMYALCFVYLLDLLLLRLCAEDRPENRRQHFCSVVSYALVAFLLWGNVQTANTLYIKKDLEQQSTLSEMTAVCTRLEETEGYVPGETPVVFLGTSADTATDAFGSVSEITGASYTSSIGAGYYEAYFSYILQTPLRLGDTWAVGADPRAALLPVFPAEGSVCWIDGTLVVRMG